MTVLNFPSTAGQPTDGSFTYTANGVVYRWDGEKWVSNTQSNAGGGGRSEPVHFDGPDAPDFTSLIAGDQWYNTNDGRLYTYTLNADNDLVWIDASPDSQVPQFWERNGTTLEPTTASDSVDIGSGSIQLNADGSSNFSDQLTVSFDQSSGFVASFVNTNTTSGDGIYINERDDGSAIVIQRQSDNQNSVLISGNGSATFASLKTVFNNTTTLADLRNTGQNVFYRPTNSGSASVIAVKSDVNGAGTGIFEITANGHVAARKTTIDPIGSERRVKENIELIDSATAWETIKSTPYYSYNYIGSDPSDVNYGPIVDEVPAEMVIQPMMENEAGEVVARSDSEGPIRSFDNGMLQARLYTALQTALTRIEALEAEVQQLKGGN